MQYSYVLYREDKKTRSAFITIDARYNLYYTWRFNLDSVKMYKLWGRKIPLVK